MKPIIKKLIITGILGVIFLLLMILRNNEAFADFYVRYISTNIVKVISVISCWLPFNILEAFVLFAFIFMLYLVVYSIVKLFKKQFTESLDKFMILILFVGITLDVYVGLASISYGRSKVPVNQYEGEVSQELIDNTFDYYLKDFNDVASRLSFDEDHFLISPYSFDETVKMIHKEYDKLDDSYLNPFNGSVKGLWISPLFSELHLTGVTWAPGGDILVNTCVPSCELPHTIAHELAHSKGVYKEDEANLVALSVLLNSDDDYLRYCGYHVGFTSLLDIYYYTDRDKWGKGWGQLSQEIYDQYVARNKYWEEHDLLADISEWWNDLYLKMNGNENGVDDYEDTEEKEDTGQTDENNNPVYVISEYSPYQKLFFWNYLNK